mgnify:CR=1 FL=1
MASGFDLAVLPSDAIVAVVKSEAGGDCVAQVLARTAEIVVIQQFSPERDKANNQAEWASFFQRILWRSGAASDRLRLGGNHGTHTKQVWISAFGIF